MIAAAKLLQLITIAAQLSGYPQPAPSVVPEVHEIGTEEIERMRGPLVVGVYVPGSGGNIYIDTEWLNGEQNQTPARGFQYTEESFLIHELTHWLQDINGWHRGGACMDHLYREVQAYAVQNRYEELYEPSHGENSQHDVPPMCGLKLVWKKDHK